jgi:hypothetical protein
MLIKNLIKSLNLSPTQLKCLYVGSELLGLIPTISFIRIQRYFGAILLSFMFLRSMFMILTPRPYLHDSIITHIIEFSVTLYGLYICLLFGSFIKITIIIIVIMLKIGSGIAMRECRNIDTYAIYYTSYHTMIYISLYFIVW